MDKTVTASLIIAHPSKAPIHVYGQYSEVDDGAGPQWVRRVERRVDLDGCNRADAIAVIDDASEGLTNCLLEEDLWSEYGEGGTFLKLRGYRPVTEEEQQWINVGIAASMQRKRDQAEYIQCERCQVRHLPPAHTMLDILEDRQS
jgi:hypothetical protein